MTRTECADNSHVPVKPTPTQNCLIFCSCRIPITLNIGRISHENWTAKSTQEKFCSIDQTQGPDVEFSVGVTTFKRFSFRAKSTVIHSKKLFQCIWIKTNDYSSLMKEYSLKIQLTTTVTLEGYHNRRGKSWGGRSCLEFYQVTVVRLKFNLMEYHSPGMSWKLFRQTQHAMFTQTKSGPTTVKWLGEVTLQSIRLTPLWTTI